MATALSTPDWSRRLFTIEEYRRMADAGILVEDDRVELIEGEIVEMRAIGKEHAACVNELARLFITRLNDRAIVSIQNPVQLPPRSEPQPDLLVLRPRADRYREALPGPQDVLLLIEVADTSLARDRGIKLGLYAGVGIPEVWIVDLQRRRVLVHRRPVGDMYAEAVVVDQGTLAPAAFPDASVTVDEVFG